VAKSYEVKVRLKGKDEVSPAAKSAEGSVSKLSGTLKKGLAVAAAAAAGALFAVVKIFKSVTEAAKVQEAAIVSLDGALASLGEEGKKISLNLQEQASALQKVTKFGDEQIIAGQALIASFTKNEEQIKKATTAALNLASGVGVDLKAAFLLMGKAAAGETSTLSRYGIVLEKGLSPQEKFAAALEKVNEQFAGRAQADAKKYGGLTQQLANAWGDLKEKVGFAITENEELLSVLTKIRDVFTTGKLVESVEKFAEGLSGAITTTIDFARGVREMVAALKEYDNQISTTSPGTELLKIALEGLIEKYAQGPEALTAWGEAIRLQKEAEEAAAAVKVELISKQQQLDAAYLKALGINEAYGIASDKVKVTTELTKDEIDELNAALKANADAYEAAVDSAKAFGEVTSVELANKISEIALALELQKSILGENSREYVRLEEVATARIESLRERIVNLKDGLGDLKVETDETSGSIQEYGTRADEAAEGVDTLAGANDRLADSVERARTVVSRSTGIVDAMRDRHGQPFFGALSGARYTVVLPTRTLPDGRMIP
jgi:hypothetical protein